MCRRLGDCITVHYGVHYGAITVTVYYHYGDSLLIHLIIIPSIPLNNLNN